MEAKSLGFSLLVDLRHLNLSFGSQNLVFEYKNNQLAEWWYKKNYFIQRCYEDIINEINESSTNSTDLCLGSGLTEIFISFEQIKTLLNKLIENKISDHFIPSFFLLSL